MNPRPARNSFGVRLPRSPWWRLRNNWANAWRIGRFEFEVEWVPRARYYTFSFTLHDPRGEQ